MAKKMKMQNKDVPCESILKQVLKENGQLKSEIAYLENELARHKRMVKDFKAWQAKVADFKYHYWLQQGLELMSQLPDKEEVLALKGLLGQCDKFDVYWKKCNRIMNNLDVYRGKLSPQNLLSNELKSDGQGNVPQEG